MTAREIAEKLTDHMFDGDLQAITLTFDGAWYPDSMLIARGWCTAEDAVAAIRSDLHSTPTVEVLVNAIVGLNTDPSTGGIRQHTESVNNFTVRTGKLIGIRVERYATRGSDVIFYLYTEVYNNA